jgi:putative ABC transport system ATP-binding protein
MADAVEMAGVTFAYGVGELRREVLKDVSLAVAPGEIVLLTGPSGSGKTTLLTLIGALRAMQEGSAVVLGQQMRGATEAQRVRLRRRIGYIFQNTTCWASCPRGRTWPWRSNSTAPWGRPPGWSAPGRCSPPWASPTMPRSSGPDVGRAAPARRVARALVARPGLCWPTSRPPPSTASPARRWCC